jgi:hypothetical protein
VIANDISLLGRYTNDFGVYLWGENSEASQNNIHGQSRGIQLDGGSESVVRGNRIEVFEKPVNEEYKGCQIGGAFGIQVESKSKRGLVERNDVLGLADECDARAYRQTDTPAGSGNHTRNNRFVARTARSDAKGKAISASFAGVGSSRMEGDILEADFANVELGWEGAHDVVLRNVTFIKGAHASSKYATFYLRPGANKGISPDRSASLKVIDGKFLNGASPDSYSMVPVGFEKWGQFAEYYIQWTFQLKLTGRDKNPIKGATVVLTGGANESYEFATDEEGLTPPTVLTEFRRYNTTEGIEKQAFEYKVSIRHGGRSEEFPIRVTGRTILTRQLR